MAGNPSRTVAKASNSDATAAPHPAFSTKIEFDACSSIQEIIQTAARYATEDTGEEPSDHVYKLWSDFEVTHEKGGWAYGNRTMHTAKWKLDMREFPHAAMVAFFPHKRNAQDTVYGYMICPQAIAEAAHNRAEEILGTLQR